MTAADLGAVLKGIAPVVREFIAGSVESLVKRLEAIEARPVIHGKDGRDGERGPQGEKGEIGRDGKNGEPGVNGQRGASISVSKGRPDSDRQLVGDLCVDSETGDLYRWVSE